ncbi:hypothetical protein, partial [uncultured Amnibacterium sp.]|uniref:hypothetical protein n=1 Tax=uncultured Amnibacterium sp. TaxID=1631851 RepID=UPI0035CB0D4C
MATGSVAALADTLPSGTSSTGITGLRPNATRLSFRLSDHTQASVDVATGDLDLSTVLRTLPGVSASVPITLAYNSRADGPGDHFLGAADASGWTYGIAGAGSLSLQSDGSTVDFTSTDGAVWPFAAVSGSSSAYVSPAGIKAVLMKTTNGWTLSSLDSSQIVTFDGTGRPISVADRNGNATSIDWSTGVVTSSAGAVDARKLFLGYDSTYHAEHFGQQHSGSTVRDQQVSQDGSGRVQSWTNPTGASTFVEYDASGRVAKFYNEGDEELDIAYDSSNRVTSVSQVDHSTSPTAATAVTRLSYPSSTQTLVAGPNTSQSSSVAAVAHLTYTVDPSTGLVTHATDQMGRDRAATYNANLDTLTSTTGSGASATTTTNTYGANGGMSQTQSAVSSGATASAAYANTPASSQYLPSSTTDDAGNTSTFTFDGAGNQLTAQASAVAAQAAVTYNPDGTVASATLPGNAAAANSTTYHYDSNHQLTAVTPVAGSSLGTKYFTYDVYGRLKTATDGAGRTTTYTYDGADRVLTTAFSDSTPTVTNTYDDAGNVTKQVSGGGTITNRYDTFNRLTSTSNTAGGGTISYTYDKAGNRASMTTSKGTTNYVYDASNVLTTVNYPANSNPTQRPVTFATDSNGRRTDEWLGTSSSWAGHVHTSYDGAGRISNVTAEAKPSGTATTVMNVDYCYNTGGSGSTCSTTAANDRSKLQWTYDHLSGQTTTYTYDGSGRLTSAAQSGGSGANRTYTYGYNSNGDRTSAVVSGSSSSSQSLTYNAADQITSSGYTYDGAGNMTGAPGKTFTYNAAEQMTGATV